MTLVRTVLALVVAIGAVGVLLGVGQGSPPPRAAISKKALASEQRRVARASRVARTGAAVFDAQHCGSCHTVAASGSKGRLGPRLDVALKDIPRIGIESFITNPKTVDLPGFDNHLMPRNYEQRISPGEIRALASYLHATAG